FALVALSPAAERPRTHPQNLGGPEPVQLATDRLQHPFLYQHRPLPRGRRILHGASRLRCRIPVAAFYEAVRSLALGSDQIMYSLHTGAPRLTTDLCVCY